MHKIIMAIALGTCFAAGPALSQDTYTFAGVSWGSNRADVKTVLVGKGYVFDKLDEDGDLSFTGNMWNTPTRIFAMFDPQDRLVKIGVTLVTPDEDAKPKYQVAVEQLGAKYGTPDLVVHRFDSPFEAGDGKEQAAIQEGRGHFATCWTHGQKVLGGVAQDALCSDITKNLTVRISYESIRWDQEADRRTARAAKDL